MLRKTVFERPGSHTVIKFRAELTGSLINHMSATAGYPQLADVTRAWRREGPVVFSSQISRTFDYHPSCNAISRELLPGNTGKCFRDVRYAQDGEFLINRWSVGLVGIVGHGCLHVLINELLGIARFLKVRSELS